MTGGKNLLTKSVSLRLVPLISCFKRREVIFNRGIFVSAARKIDVAYGVYVLWSS